MHQVCYFEIPAGDIARARKFYGELFGWTFTEQTMGKTPYWTIKAGNGISGGLMERQGQDQPPLNYVLVADLDSSLDKAKSLGAEVLVGKTTLPAMGYFAIVLDTEKNSIGLWQADESAK